MTETIKWLRKRWESEPEMIFVIGFSAFIVIVLGVVIYQEFEIYRPEQARLLAQCLADGKKEYECTSLLQRHGQQLPIVVPIYSGR